MEAIFFQLVEETWQRVVKRNNGKNNDTSFSSVARVTRKMPGFLFLHPATASHLECDKQNMKTLL